MSHSYKEERLLAFTLLGPPGSGKGTQSKYLKQQLGFQHISTGDLCRAATNRNDPSSESLKALMQQGELLPDEFILSLLMEQLTSVVNGPEVPKGIILDGFPRNLNQAQLVPQLEQVDHLTYLGLIYLDVPDDVVVQRLLKRATEQTQRQDDRENIIRERLRVYHEKTLPLLDLFQDQYRILKIDGLGATEEVFHRIAPAIQEWEKSSLLNSQEP